MRRNNFGVVAILLSWQAHWTGEVKKYFSSFGGLTQPILRGKHRKPFVLIMDIKCVKTNHNHQFANKNAPWKCSEFCTPKGRNIFIFTFKLTNLNLENRNMVSFEARIDRLRCKHEQFWGTKKFHMVLCERHSQHRWNVQSNAPGGDMFWKKKDCQECKERKEHGFIELLLQNFKISLSKRGTFATNVRKVANIFQHESRVLVTLHHHLSN